MAIAAGGPECRKSMNLQAGPGWNRKGSLTDLLSQFFGFGLLQLGDLRQGFVAVDTASPVTTDLIETVVEVVSRGLDDFAQSTLVLGVSVGDGESGAGLSSDDSADSSFAFNDAVRDAHLAAKSRQMHHQFDRVHVVSDHHQLSLLILNQRGHRVEALSDDGRSLARGILLAVDLLFSLGQEPLLLGLSALRSVLVQQLKHLSSRGSVEGHCELVDGRRDLEALLEDGLLPLQDDVLGPSDEAGQIALGLDILPDAEILGPLFEERVDRLLLDFLLNDDGRRRHLLPALLSFPFHRSFRHFFFFFFKTFKKS